MNSTTTVTDTAMVESCSSAFFGDVLPVLLLESSEQTSPTADYLNGETISVPDTILIEGEPVLTGDPLLPAFECRPPSRKRRKLTPKVNTNSNSSSPDSPIHSNWPCAFCERYFTAKKTLYKHYRTVHPNRHCAQCVNPNLNSGATTSKQESKRPKKTPKQVEDQLRAQYFIRECKVVVKRLTDREIAEETRVAPMPRATDGFPCICSRAKAVEAAEVESFIDGDLLIVGGDDVLTHEVVIEEPRVVSPEWEFGERRKALLECEICGEIYAHRMELMNHLRLKHSGKKVPQFKCDNCSVEFDVLLQYEAHVDRCLLKDCEGFVSAYRGRNLFEELTNFRAVPVDDEDDAIIMRAESQLMNSPTSTKSLELDEKICGERVCAKRKLEDYKVGKKRKKDEFEEIKAAGERKFVLGARKGGVLEEISKNPRNELRKCCQRDRVKCKNDICMSPRVVIHRMSPRKRVASPTKVVPNPPKGLNRPILTPKTRNQQQPPKKRRRRTRTRTITIDPTTGAPRKRGRPRKNVPKTDSGTQTTFKIFGEDDCTFSGSENETKSDENEYVNVEDDDEDDLNLTLSDDDKLEIDVLNVSQENLQLNLLDFDNENLRMDDSQFALGAEVKTVEQPERENNITSTCFSVFV